MSAPFADGAAALAGTTALLLGWRPDEFWAATPAELAAIMRAGQAPGAAPPARDDLLRLMKEYPDG